MAEWKEPFQPSDDAGAASAEEGVVILDGPFSVAVTFTPEAALRTSENLRLAAKLAREQRERALRKEVSGL